jgi:hypothetical protein
LQDTTPVVLSTLTPAAPVPDLLGALGHFFNAPIRAIVGEEPVRILNTSLVQTQTLARSAVLGAIEQVKGIATVSPVVALAKVLGVDKSIKTEMIVAGVAVVAVVILLFALVGRMSGQHTERVIGSLERRHTKFNVNTPYGGGGADISPVSNH